MKEDQPNVTEKAIPAPPGNARNTSSGRKSRDTSQINGLLDTTHRDGMSNTRGTQATFTTYQIVVSSRNMSTHPNIRQCTGQTALSEPAESTITSRCDTAMCRLGDNGMKECSRKRKPSMKTNSQKIRLFSHEAARGV